MAWNDEQRRQIERLEGVQQPTAYQRGELAALRISATSQSDERRVQEVTDRWAAAS